MTPRSQPHAPRPSRESLGWWRARLMARWTGRDAVFALVLLLLAFASVYSGNRAALSLSPSAAAAAVESFLKLEMPKRLPDAPLVDESGGAHSLYELIRVDRVIVAFYAPWCAPCQKEVSELAETFKEDNSFLVVVSKEEDTEDTRRKLDDLGLTDLPFYVDATESLQREGRVASLPTVFVVMRTGRVLERIEGYSEMTLIRLNMELATED